MFSLKQLFFFILGINCLFLIAFFLSVRTPESFTSNTNALQKQDGDKTANSLSDLITGDVSKHRTDEDNDAQLMGFRDSSLKAIHEASKEAEDKVREAEQRVKEANEKIQAVESKLNETLKRRDQVREALRWNNPFFKMGAYPKVLDKYFNSYPDGRPYYEKANYGIIKDLDYCELVDSYNLAHPENMFKQMNFLTDYSRTGLVRKDVIRAIGKDKVRQVSRYMPKEDFKSALYHVDPTVTNIFTKRVDMHIYHKIGEGMVCATQMYNHIPGHGVLKRKDLVVDSVDSYAQVYQDQNLQHCFNKKKFFPFSYRLYIESECKEFFEKINSKAYEDSLKKEPIQYLIKLGYGAHRAMGVFLLDKNYTADMNELYDYGAQCGRSNKSMVAQTYVTNPLLLDKNNKFDFRVYMLIASTNPVIAYYHDGFLRVSLKTYSKNSEDRSVHLTNTHLSKNDFAEAEKTNQTLADELREYQMWNFERLASYLLESGKISDPNWLDNYLRPAFKQAFIHTTRMSAYAFWNQSNVYEMFGLDFMLDDQMNLWFIECNSSPQLIGTNERKTTFLIKMLSDLFEIQYGYYRSRMKRVLKVFNKINAQAIETGVADYKAFGSEFTEAMKNRFEPEFAPKKGNSFELIMDLNLSGPEAYFGNIADECANDQN